MSADVVHGVARDNGRHSKGPITVEGKKKSSANGLRHGLPANQNTLLTAESAEEYNEVYESYIEALRPGPKAHSVSSSDSPTSTGVSNALS